MSAAVLGLGQILRVLSVVRRIHSDTPFILPGRGVFASRLIPAGTVIDISPVLVFPNQEVDEHASHTMLQHYT
jgi:hypothetical protein